MTKQEKITELLTALGKGHRLYHIFHNTEKEEFFIEYYRGTAALRCAGWGSACGLPIQRLTSILDNPYEWHVGELQEGIEN